MNHTASHLLALIQRQEEGRREDHRRFRNILSVIRVMARRTADDSDTSEDYTARLDGRLAAYIHAQSIVLRDGDVDLEMLLADELLRFGFRPGDQAELAGPPMMVAGHAAGLLALAFHELITDLVLDDGSDGPQRCLAVSWGRAPDGSLLIDWETGPKTTSGRRWPGWLQQALEQQLAMTSEQRVVAGRTVLTICLPADCVRSYDDRTNDAAAGR